MAPAELLRPGEEPWKEVLDKLCERFPDFSPGRIASVLRDNQGHAGQAAAALRDLSGDGKRRVDPDDQEHVKTILTSPAMFSMVCKDNFRKFDVNCDGVLQWTEVLPLVISLYENFGLQPPREGFLKTFFDASDLNKDGVLSEKEFKRFFECFLRYAFFDVVQKHNSSPTRQYQPENQSLQPEVLRKKRSPANASAASHSPLADRPPRLPSDLQHDASALVRTRKSERAEVIDGTTGYASCSDNVLAPRCPSRGSSVKRHSEKDGIIFDSRRVLRVVAPNGIALRKTPNVNDRLDVAVPAGERVTVLETWVRTANGWLPVYDPAGQMLLEPVQADSEPSQQLSQTGGSTSSQQPERPSRSKGQSEAALLEGFRSGDIRGSFLQKGEEEWRERFERLQERFSLVSPDYILQVLRRCGGHAGQAASALREVGHHSGRPGGS